MPMKGENNQRQLVVPGFREDRLCQLRGAGWRGLARCRVEHIFATTGKAFDLLNSLFR